MSINVSNQFATFNFNYDAPIIYSIHPLTGPTAGGSTIQLHGLNFGLGTLTLFTLGGVTVTQLTSIISHNHTDILFKLPVGEGVNKAVALQVASQPATYTGSTLFRYNTPNITYVHGCFGDQAPQAALCPIDGSLYITIVGTDFGNDVSQISVTVGTNTCPSITLITAHTTISCHLLAQPHGGFNQLVTITVATQKSVSRPYVSYQGPIISPHTIRLKGSSTLSTHLTLPTQPPPAVDITFGGRFFGSNASAVSIMYGLAGGSEQYSCPLVAGSLTVDGNGYNNVSCSVGAGLFAPFLLPVLTRNCCQALARISCSK